MRRLAKHCGASVVLIHVADGWAARNVNALTLRESEEIKSDREYIERCRAELEADGHRHGGGAGVRATPPRRSWRRPSAKVPT